MYPLLAFSVVVWGVFLERMWFLMKFKREFRDLYLKAKAGGNVIREMIDAYKAKATIGEAMGAIREAMGYDYDVFGMVERPSYLKYDR